MFSVDTIITAILTGIVRIIGKIPRKIAMRLGNVLGYLFYILDKRHRDVAIDNLSHAFGNEKTPEEIKQLAKHVFQNIAQIIFEIGWLMNQTQSDLKHHVAIEGLENLENALKKNKGVLLLTGHLGCWELISIPFVLTGYIHITNGLYRPIEFSPADRFLIKTRTRFGGTLIPKDHSMRKIIKSLKQNEIVVLLMDQNVKWHKGVFADFFNRSACTNKGLALLALKTGAPVVSCFIVRDRAGFKAVFGNEVPLIQTGDKTKDIEANTQLYNNAIENVVRQYPEQWFWVHKRWKTKPHMPWPRQ